MQHPLPTLLVSQLTGFMLNFVASPVCLDDFKNERISMQLEKVINTFSDKKLQNLLLASCRQSLATWFSVGLLQLQPIHWESSSAALLEKVMEYEAVHPIQGWQDLKQRLGPMRRCPALLWPQRANKNHSLCPMYRVYYEFLTLSSTQSACNMSALQPACDNSQWGTCQLKKLSAEEQSMNALLHAI